MVHCKAYYLRNCVKGIQEGIENNDLFKEAVNYGKLLGMRGFGKNKIDRDIADYLIKLYLKSDGSFNYLNPASINYDLTLSNYKKKLNVLG